MIAPRTYAARIWNNQVAVAAPCGQWANVFIAAFSVIGCGEFVSNVG